MEDVKASQSPPQVEVDSKLFHIEERNIHNVERQWSLAAQVQPESLLVDTTSCHNMSVHTGKSP